MDFDEEDAKPFYDDKARPVARTSRRRQSGLHPSYLDFVERSRRQSQSIRYQEEDDNEFAEEVPLTTRRNPWKTPRAQTTVREPRERRQSIRLADLDQNDLSALFEQFAAQVAATPAATRPVRAAFTAPAKGPTTSRFGFARPPKRDAPKIPEESEDEQENPDDGRQEETNPSPPRPKDSEDFESCAGSSANETPKSSPPPSPKPKPKGKPKAPPRADASAYPRNGCVRVDGRILDIVMRPADEFALQTNRLWNKEKRAELTGEVKQVFVKAATGYVLGKHSKFQQQSLKVDEEGALEKVLNLQTQLETVRSHCESHDIIDVCTIMFPATDFTKDPRIADHVSLFEDYARLTPEIVANSCYWYNRYVRQEYIRENMVLIFKLLQNNTEEQLWTKSLEEYHEFIEIQRGGPLMLILILKRIQNSSETAVLHLKDSLQKLSIKKLPGENVDNAVSLVKSTYRLLIAASTDSRNYVPEDFAHTVLKIYQTTSVPEFNAQFKRLEQDALMESDLHGKMPQFPEVAELNSLATNSYARLKNDGWDAPKGKRALNAQANTNGGKGKGKRPYQPPVCFNCGGSHFLNQCKAPRDKAKIDAAREKFNRERNQRKSQSSDRSERKPKMINGQPMILNKKGVYVLDQKTYKANKAAKAEAMDVIKKALTSSTTTTSDSPAREGATPAPAPAPKPEQPPAAPQKRTYFADADLDAAFATMSLN